MSAPKHLWSGDWQQESAAAAQERAARRVRPTDPEPAIAPPPPRRRRRRAVSLPPGWRRALPVVLVAVVLLAGAAYGLSALLASAGTPAATAGAPAASPQATAASGPSRPVNWLGMEIQTLAPGAAVIDTVRAGSAGALGGLEPGDVIVAVNDRLIRRTGDIAPAIRGLRIGDAVQLQISHGSGLRRTEVPLTAPPSLYP